jgi:predicted negative regulator of RcsB-dependent stress response
MKHTADWVTAAIILLFVVLFGWVIWADIIVPEMHR